MVTDMFTAAAVLGEIVQHRMIDAGKSGRCMRVRYASHHLAGLATGCTLGTDSGEVTFVTRHPRESRAYELGMVPDEVVPVGSPDEEFIRTMLRGEALGARRSLEGALMGLTEDALRRLELQQPEGAAVDIDSGPPGRVLQRTASEDAHFL